MESDKKTGIKKNDDDNRDDDSTSKTEIETLQQMEEILAGDVNASKQQLDFTKRVCGEFRKMFVSNSGTVLGAESGKEGNHENVGSLREALHHMEFELEAAHQQNVVLSQHGQAVEQKLAQTREELEDVIEELSHTRMREQGRIILAGQKHHRDDDESTETENGSEVYSSESGRRSEDDESDDDEEQAPPADSEVIDLVDSPPRPKKQRISPEHHGEEDV